MKEGHTAQTKHSFRKKLLVSIIAFFLVSIAWLFWQLFAYNNAVRMAKKAGFSWYSQNPISLIREDWRNALDKETWRQKDRALQMVEVSNLHDYREMLHILRPNYLLLYNCTKLQNLDGLRNLTSLVELDLKNCRELKNVDGLKALTALRVINLSGCTELKSIDGLKNINTLSYLNLSGCNSLQNVDNLKNLTHLKILELSGCTELQNVDGLKELTSLEELFLHNCTELKNVDGIKGLSNLSYITLNDCHKIPAAALRELHAALPQTNIDFPDGTSTPP